MANDPLIDEMIRREAARRGMDLSKMKAPERTWGEWLTGSNPTPKQQAAVSAQNEALKQNNPGMDKSYGQLWDDFKNARIQTDAQGEPYSQGAASLAQGFTFGNADEALRAVGMDKWANKIERESDVFKKDHPVGDLAYKGLGSVMSAMTLGRGLSAIPGVASTFGPTAPLLNKMVGSAISGGSQGAAWEHGRRGSTGESILKEGLIGAGLGAGVTGLIGGIDAGWQALRRFTGSGPQQSIISGNIDEIIQKTRKAAADFEDGATKLYQHADDIGATLKPQAATAVREAMLKRLQPHVFVGGKDAGTARVARWIAQNVPRNKPLGLTKMQKMSEFINDMIDGNTNKSDVRQLMMLKGALDDMLDRVPQSQLLNGSTEALEVWNDARKLWSHAKFTEEMRNIVDMIDVKAQGHYTQSGLTNAAKTRAQAIYKNIIEGTDKRWAKMPEAVEMWRTLATGGGGGKGMRLMQKFAPKGVISTTLGAGIGSKAGSAIGGLFGGPLGATIGGGVGGAAVPMAGAATDALVERNVTKMLGDLASMAVAGESGVAPQLMKGVSPSFLSQIMTPSVAATEATRASLRPPYRGY